MLWRRIGTNEGYFFTRSIRSRKKNSKERRNLAIVQTTVKEIAKTKEVQKK